MYGIATTSTAGSNESNNRLMLVEVTGAFHKQVHNSNYIIKVPFNRLSQTIQRIARTGGKVVNVTMSLLDVSDNKVSSTFKSTKQQANTEVEIIPQAIEVLSPIETVVNAVQEFSSVEATAVKETTAKPASGKTRNLGKKSVEKAPKNTKRGKKPRS